ncbi:hypothetical protein [Streptomyces sp. NPDC005780]|uniref:hypothetical protein n=1 Tax=Streptomyces sp. NPDC005780 TaxID=3364730 RepID=UPI0036850E25
MGIRYVVLGETRQECEEGLAGLCADVGARVVQQPAQLAGPRWIGRAVPHTKAPAEEGRG